MKTKAFTRCGDQVLADFARLASRARVLRQKDLAGFLSSHIGSWDTRQDTRAYELIEFLTANRVLQAIEMASESEYAPVKRFVTPDVTPFELALDLRKNSYLTHSTAVFLHGLTDQVPQTIYVNAEQSPKPKPKGGLTQESLDRAFRVQQRSSRYVFIHERNRFVVLSGKNTGGYGVIEVSPDGVSLRTTSLERTLVDITVRPVYGGGVHEVMDAFRAAVDRVSFSKLIATLRSLDYVYPYHQALGFYLERAGAPAKGLQRLRDLGIEFDFYLAHGAKDLVHDSSWRVLHPKGL